MQSLPTLAILIALALSGITLLRLDRQRQHRQDQELTAKLLLGLDLMQGVQRHRALGAQSGSDATRNRQALEAQLARAWNAWADSGDLADWHRLLRAPEDFDGHCRLLESLLDQIRYLELQRCHLLGTTPEIADRCWTVEDLGRLRGLSIRAAAHQQCRLELQVQLLYLRDRLLTDADESLRGALAQVTDNLLGGQRMTIQPAELYSLLTPLIDKRIEAIRSTLSTERLDGLHRAA